MIAPSSPAYAGVLTELLDGTDPSGATIILDIPTGNALDELDRMTTHERREAIIITFATHPAYHDVLASYYVRNVTIAHSEASLTIMRALLHDPGFIPTYQPKTGLTYSQARVLRYLLRGFTTNEVAERLGNSPKTIASHASTLIRKFGVETRAELIGQLLTGKRGNREAVPA